VNNAAGAATGLVDLDSEREGTPFHQAIRTQRHAQLTDPLHVPVPQQQVAGAGFDRRHRLFHVVDEHRDHHVEAGTVHTLDRLVDVGAPGAQVRRPGPGDGVEHGVVVIAVDHGDAPAGDAALDQAEGVGGRDHPADRFGAAEADAHRKHHRLGGGGDLGGVEVLDLERCCSLLAAGGSLQGVDGLGGPHTEEGHGHGVVSICGARAYPVSSIDRRHLGQHGRVEPVFGDELGVDREAGHELETCRLGPGPSSSRCGQGASGLTQSMVSGDTPPQSLIPASR
jgi:hypothetical protein